jgi:hypothetical protein
MIEILVDKKDVLLFQQYLNGQCDKEYSGKVKEYENVLMGLDDEALTYEFNEFEIGRRK